jgi:hypothetical protein
MSRLLAVAGEDEFYRTFISLGDTNDFRQQRVRALGLVDTNNGVAKVTGTLNLETLKEEGGISGIRFGMTMEQIVTSWGKPKWLWANCFGGLPTMCYQDVVLGFDGNSLKDIRFNTDTGNVAFTNGFSPTSSMDEYVKKLGEPAVRKGSSERGLLIHTSAKAKMTLQFDDGRIITIRLSKPNAPMAK